MTTVPGWQGTSALGDYDGDGLVDAVVAVNGHFQVTLSSNHSSFTEWFGNPGDIPEPGDWMGSQHCSDCTTNIYDQYVHVKQHTLHLLLDRWRFICREL